MEICASLRVGRGYASPCGTPGSAIARSRKGPTSGSWPGSSIAVEETVTEAALVLARKIVGEGADFLTLLKGEDLAEATSRAILEGIRTSTKTSRSRSGTAGSRCIRSDGGRVTTAVVTDSTTSLAPGVLERPDVRMVPLTFHFGPDETYTDKVDMSNAEFYERLRDSDVFPTTAQPAPGAFVRDLRGALRLRRHPGPYALGRVQRHLRLRPAGGGDGRPAGTRARLRGAPRWGRV